MDCKNWDNLTRSCLQTLFLAWKSPIQARSASLMPKSKLSSLVLCKLMCKMLKWSNKFMKSANISKMIRKIKGWKYCNNCSIIAKFPPSTQLPPLTPRRKSSRTPRRLPRSRHQPRLQQLRQRRSQPLSRASRCYQQPRSHSNNRCPAISAPIQIPTRKLWWTRTKTSRKCKASSTLRATRSSRLSISNSRPSTHWSRLAHKVSVVSCTPPSQESPAPLIVPPGDALSEKGAYSLTRLALYNTSPPSDRTGWCSELGKMNFLPAKQLVEPLP